jgi:hypothetical protein
VLAGPPECRDLVLSSPVILYDHPEVAPESAGDLFDATEIDEILTLRTLALTDQERQEARATDPRAAELIDRLDDLPPEMLERMHGAIRYHRRDRERPPPRPRSPSPPRGPGPALVDPGSDHPVSLRPTMSWSPGSRSPGEPGCDATWCSPRRRTGPSHRARSAEEAVRTTWTPGTSRSARSVTPAELQRNHGRFLYFAPDELEPVEAQSGRKEGTQ